MAVLQRFCFKQFIQNKVNDIHKYNVKMVGSDSKPVVYLDHLCYVLDTQLNKVGSSSELIYFYKQQNIIRGNYDKQGVLLF